MASSSENPELSSDGSRRNCPICMDPVQDDKQKFLSCAHVFHQPCIDRWLADKTTCPVCRNQELPPPQMPPPRQWHMLPMVNLRGIATATAVTPHEMLPSAVRPRQQSVHGRRRSRRRGAAGHSASGRSRSRSRSRGARSRSRAARNSEPPSGDGNDLA